MDLDARLQQAKSLIAAGEPAGIAELAACAEAGHPSACFHLAELRLEAGDAGAALPLLRRAAETGHARACFRLGLLYAKGDAGLAADRDAARRWCTRAAEQGLAVAQFNCALLAAADGDVVAERWFQLAAINGVNEADACLEQIYPPMDGGSRPRTWDTAETRASVALARSDPDAPKTLRFADYYLDPCLDLLTQRLSLRQEAIEDIVQDFFLELEQPLSKGALAGRTWKEALRARFDPTRGRFRPFLARALVNFARDRLRSARARTSGTTPSEEITTIEQHRDAWLAELVRFQAEAGRDAGPTAQRAVGALAAQLAEGIDHLAQGERLGLNERTVRRDLRIAAGLLQDWLHHQLDALPAGHPTTDALRRGLELVPEWLFRLSADKRSRLLSLLALLHRQRERG